MTKKDKSGKPQDRNDKDLQLWRQVMRDVKPLHKDTGRSPQPPPETSPKPAQTEDVHTGPFKRTPPEPRGAPALLPLAHGSSSGVDRRRANRFRRGKLPIEATLDLHGHKRDQARAELAHFLAASQDRGLRCVLLITGKGLSRSEGGVLRQAVPQWLNEPPNRARVLSFDYAQPQHGGLGALYVLLKRTRDPGKAKL